MPKLEARIGVLEEEMSAPGFWEDKDTAQKKMSEVASLKGRLNPFRDLVRRVDDLEVLIELAREEGTSEAAAEVKREFSEIEDGLEEFELVLLLRGEFDKGNAFLTVHAGAGGTESCDWAEMLLRMYQRYAERHGFESELVDISYGEEAGIRSATVKLVGEYAFGFLQTERGVHRLVRISPFDAQSRRHTSFASIDVVPEVDDEIDIRIEEKDLRVDTFRSGGKGGQNVNKVETGVRYTHLPSGISVACTQERSQLKNRNLAMRLLKAKLYQLEQDKKRSELERQYGEKGEIAWGSQIRSYVFQPYQLVKDHRTGHESGNIQDVMDGNLDGFIEAKLRGRKAGDSDDDRDLP